MDIEDVEADIVAELQAQITGAGIKIASFPDNPDRYLKNHGSKVSILVRFDGENSDDPNQDALREKVINQKPVIDWAVSFVGRGLRTHAGLYAYIKSVRQKLTEYTPGTRTGGSVQTDLKVCSMMWHVSTKFLSQDAGLWIYESIFRHDTEETKNN